MTAELALERVAWLWRILPGIVLCLFIALLSDRLAPAETALTGRIVIDPVATLLVVFVACLLGCRF